MREDVTPAQLRTARIVAVAADLLQIALLPALFPASLSPALNVIDVVVALVMLRLLGWHWAFVPAFLLELVPIVELVPTWTAAVFLVTRGEPPALPPGRQPPSDSAGS
jgi:hypothetical protein